MIDITDFKVESTTGESFAVSWKPFPVDSVDLSKYRYSLKRAGAPHTKYDVSDGDVLLDLVADTYTFLDDRAESLASRNRKTWYILRVTNSETEATKDFGPVVVSYPDMDYKWGPRSEIVRRLDWLLKCWTGREVYVFKARTWGPKCPACWDDLKERTRSSRCEECYNTGIWKGFFNPITAHANFNPDTDQTNLSPLGELEINESYVLMTDYPKITVRDLIVEPETNRRWRVSSSTTTELRRTMAHQYAKIKELDPHEDIEYKLDVGLADG